MAKMDILVVGGGGREHALVWKIAQSPLVEKVYCAPGNGGTAGADKTENVPIGVDKFEELSQFAKDKKIDLVVIGPDNPLADGIVDHMEKHGLKVFGPRQASARLESSKSHAKNVMTELGIPTARFGVFDNKQEALEFVKANDWARVIKEDGLALGKGVIVCDSVSEAEAAINKMYGEEKSGAKNIVVIEDRLEGEELSLFLLCDGKNTLTLAASQDHKRRFDGDKGPNTGGMGAYSPVSLYEQYRKEIEAQVVSPIREALKNGKLSYKGVLFIGILVQEGIPYVLEFNARFGDPETQALMPRLKSDIVPALLASAEGTLAGMTLEWDPRFSCCVVACADKYPESSSRGEAIKLGDMPPGTTIFQAGTALKDGLLTTNGGRVLAVTALHDDPETAQKLAYQTLKNISFNGMDYRKDIAWRVAADKRSEPSGSVKSSESREPSERNGSNGSLKIAVFISGRGSNLNAIIQAISDRRLDATIQCVVSNDEEAPGLLIAKQHGLETFALSHKGMKRAEHEEKLLAYLKQYEIDFVVLAGYMRVISPSFLRNFEDTRGFFRVINIHPSLLPAFPGTSGYEDAYNYGVKVSGVTVHLVDEKVDHGLILAQEPFPRFPDDTLQTFCARGLSVEHALYPAVLQQIAKKGVQVTERKNKVESAK